MDAIVGPTGLATVHVPETAFISGLKLRHYPGAESLALVYKLAGGAPGFTWSFWPREVPGLK
jgi:hypothetical protein